MHSFSLSRRIVGLVTVCFAVIAALGGVVLYHSQAAPASALATLPDNLSAVPQGSQSLGEHPAAAGMAVAIVLRPQHEAELNSLVTALYDPQSASFHHWLAKGEYNARFAPSASQIAQVRQYL